MAYTVFISYAHEDRAYLGGLHKHLSNLRNQGLISEWHDDDIIAGTEWRTQIMNHVNTDQIILLLISADFMNSEFCYSTEMKKAMERHKAGQARVIPILLRPTDWEGAPFDQLRMLPSEEKPISTWSDRDAAFIDVVKSIRKVILDLQASTNAHSTPKQASEQTSESSKVQTESTNANILLVTATAVEVRAVLKQVTASTIKHVGNQTYHDLGSVENARVFMVQSEMGPNDPGGSMLVIEEAIRLLNPSSVIMVGIAFGMDESKQSIGDILVSKQLVQYDIQRVGINKTDQQEQILLRGDRPSASFRLLQKFRAAAIYWDSPPEVIFGSLLTGAKLVDNQDFRDQLLQLAGEAVGGEMEAGGLYAPAQRKGVDWIVVKAICDWGDGNKSQDKEERQLKAAENAARFTFDVLKKGGFVPESGTTPNPH